MRVIECNECGETLSSDNDDQLAKTLLAHMQSLHSEVKFEPDDAAELVEDSAYSASDS